MKAQLSKSTHNPRMLYYHTLGHGFDPLCEINFITNPEP